MLLIYKCCIFNLKILYKNIVFINFILNLFKKKKNLLSKTNIFLEALVHFLFFNRPNIHLCFKGSKTLDRIRIYIICIYFNY